MLAAHPAHCRVQNAASTLAASPTTSSSLQPTHCGLWFPIPTLKSLVTGSRNAQGQTQSLPHSRPGSAAWAGGVVCGVTPSLKLLQLSNALSRAQCQLPSHPTDPSDPVLRQKIAALLQFLPSSYSSAELPASAGAQTAASGGECGFSSPTKNYPLLHMNKCYRAHGLSHHKPMLTVPKRRSLLGTGGRQGSSSPACPAPCLTLNSGRRVVFQQRPPVKGARGNLGLVQGRLLEAQHPGWCSKLQLAALLRCCHRAQPQAAPPAAPALPGAESSQAAALLLLQPLAGGSVPHR